MSRPLLVRFSFRPSELQSLCVKGPVDHWCHDCLGMGSSSYCSLCIKISYYWDSLAFYMDHSGLRCLRLLALKSWQFSGSPSAKCLVVSILWLKQPLALQPQLLVLSPSTIPLSPAMHLLSVCEVT